MKKKIAQRLSAIILATMFLTLIVNYFIQADNARDRMRLSSRLKINQIEEILKKNEEDFAVMQDSLKEDYIIRAKAAAYVIQYRPEIIHDQQEIAKVASLLQVDELHIFDKTGKIYAGSEPQYFGYTFNSGEQMEFFLPMLEDYSLEMVQDMMPNTAEGKLMQYTAVWQEDKKNIIQIGMEPVRLLKAQEKNELSYIFSMVTADQGTTLLVADKDTGIIAGATDVDLNGTTLEDAGIIIPSDETMEKGFKAEVKGSSYFCVFEDYGDQLIGVLELENVLYQDVFVNMLYTGIYLVLIALVMVVAILWQIDKLVIRGVDKIIHSLTKITAGNLDTRVDVDTSPEFAELSTHVNKMVQSQLNSTEKLSRIFDSADVPIGVFECNSGMNRVLVTRKVQSLFMLSDEDAAALFSNKEEFEKRLDKLLENPIKPYTDVYRLPRENNCYLRIMTFSDENSLTGIVTDITETVLERFQLEHDRDYDILTGLLNRRGFYRKMDKLFKNPDALEEAILLMTDMDHLKAINDNYGHANGDVAIQKAVALLKPGSDVKYVAGRLSGDEFVLFIYGKEKERLISEIEEIHERMMKASVTFYEDHQMDVRMSGGYVLYSDCYESYSRMLGMADEVMYQAKKRRQSEFIRWERKES